MKISNATYARCAGVLTAAMLLAGPGPAQAAVISWGPATDIAGDADVSTNGSLVAAFNFGGVGLPDQSTTVNGVSFSSFVTGSGGNASVTVGSTTLSAEPGGVLEDFVTSSSDAPFSGLSASYRILLGISAGNSSGDDYSTLTIADLVVGQSYEIQVWVNDSTQSGCCDFGIMVDGNTLAGNTARHSNGDVVAGGLGQFMIGTFTADAASQSLEIERGESAGGLNGFQLRSIAASVPEPGTAALLTLGLLGLAYRRRGNA